MTFSGIIRIESSSPGPIQWVKNNKLNFFIEISAYIRTCCRLKNYQCIYFMTTRFWTDHLPNDIEHCGTIFYTVPSFTFFISLWRDNLFHSFVFLFTTLYFFFKFSLLLYIYTFLNLFILLSQFPLLDLFAIFLFNSLFFELDSDGQILWTFSP